MKKKIHNANYHVEYGYIKARDFSLLFLALGTIFMMYRLGVYFGESRFPESTFFQTLIGILFGILGHYGIDWILKVVLTDYATVSQEETQRNQLLVRSAWALLSLTVILSLSTNSIFSRFMVIENPMEQYFSEISKQLQTDSLLAVQSLNILGTVTQKSSDEISNQVTTCRNEIETFAKSNPVLYRAFKKVRNNPKNWFWVCRSGSACTYELKQYRSQIIEMRNNCDSERLALVAASSEREAQLMSLSSAMKQDTLTGNMVELKGAAEALAAERKQDIILFNFILGFMTVGFGVVTMVVTQLLKRHRELHNQQIKDNPTRFVLVLSDSLNRVGGIFSDILHLIFFRWHEKLLEMGYLKRYSVEASNVIDFENLEKELEEEAISEKEEVRKKELEVLEVIERKKELERLRMEAEIKQAKQVAETERLRAETAAAIKEIKKDIPGIKNDTRVCDFCETSMEGRRSDAKFCSSKCRLDFHKKQKREEVS